MNGLIATLLFLSLAGLADAVLFTRAYYRNRVCPLPDDQCRSVHEHPDARLLGIPNSLLATGYYLFLTGIAAAGLRKGSVPLLDPALAFSAATLLLGAYLLYSLFVKIKGRCPG
ncbi:MAG: hypothetical protein IT210_13385 [Armatimonadetes bacterium]|nr:hypothetical protein [Armatimonadota bacterium]